MVTLLDTRRLPEAVPLHHTPRNPARPTLGPAVCAVMERLYGVAPMPWQRAAYDVAYEVDPETGELHYSHVVESVPRQSGKTTGLRAKVTHRLLYRPNQTVLGTAHNLQTALRLWRSVVAELDAPPFRDRLGVTVRKAIGDERLGLRNGSEYLVAAPTERAGHGLTLSLGLVDEAWHLPDFRLAQGLEPATVAAPSSQIHVASTAGVGSVRTRGAGDDDDAPGATPGAYFQHWVTLGRGGAHDRLCFVEYGAPTDADPADPVTWCRANPALGYAITLDKIADLFASLPVAEFQRAHLNQWTAAVEHALPPAWWEAAASGLVLDRAPGSLAIAAEAALDRSGASIVAAGWRDGAIVVELVDHRAGVDWLPDRLRELSRTYRPRGGVVLGRGGPVANVIGQLEALAVPVRPVGAAELASAAATIFDGIAPDAAPRVLHGDDPVLNAAAMAAVRKPLADRWAFALSRSVGDISPIVAASLAAWHLRTQRPGSGVLVATA